MKGELTRILGTAVAAALSLGAASAHAGVEQMGKSQGQGVAYLSGKTLENKEIVYEIVDGHAVVDGDIVLGEVDKLKADSLKSGGGSIGANGIVIDGIIISDIFRWQNGFIPYQFDAGLPATTISKVNSAIAHWTANTSIRFVQRNGTNAASYPDYVVFRSGSGCAADVGRRGGAQSVWLSTACSTGNAIHEIGHTVGFWHEQSREDRNSFVQINWANIEPGKAFNFNQQILDGKDVGTYDYGSIMHYPRTAFSVNGLPTIVPINPASATIGQRTALSTKDKSTAATLAGWTKIAGKLKQVSVGFGSQVWGVNSNDDIWRYNGNNTWTQIPGKLKHVSVGQDGVVWGVNSGDFIYRYNAWNNTWTNIPGRLKQIEVGAGGEVWGVNSGDFIYRYNAGSNSWTNIPGRLKYVSVGQNGVVWGVNSSDFIYRYNPGSNNWTNIPGLLKQVEVGSGGQVWGVNSADNIWRFDNDNTWTQAPGALKHVSVGKNGAVWGVNSADDIWRLK